MKSKKLFGSVHFIHYPMTYTIQVSFLLEKKNLFRTNAYADSPSKRFKIFNK